MELAADSSDGAFHGHLHWRSVLTLDFAGARAQLHALGRPRAAQRGPGHLCRRVCHWVGPVVGPLQLPPSGFRPGAAQRRLAGNFVADLLVGEMSQLAEKEKVYLLIENEGSQNVATAAEIADVMKLIPSKW